MPDHYFHSGINFPIAIICIFVIQLFSGTMKAIIVEDEQKNRENLQLLLARYCPEVNLIGCCSNATEAYESIVTLQPELLFLDIEMPGENGFSLLERLPQINFEVIFVTAFDHYGIKAIKFSALDYLLKPIDIHELIHAVKKAGKKINLKIENQRMYHLLRNYKLPDGNKTLAVSLADKIEFIAIHSIIRCEAENNYTTFYLKDGQKMVVSKTLKEFDELLVPYHFLRVHQSHLINLDEVKSYIKTDGGYIRMKDGSNISISRQRKEMVLKILTGKTS